MRIGFHVLQVMDESLTSPNTYRDDLLVLVQDLSCCFLSTVLLKFNMSQVRARIPLRLFDYAILRCISLPFALYVTFKVLYDLYGRSSSSFT